MGLPTSQSDDAVPASLRIAQWVVGHRLQPLGPFGAIGTFVKRPS